MKVKEALLQIERLKPWYHSMPIPCEDGFVHTPGENYDDVWANIRTVRAWLDYKDKNVLDYASFDGMWSFEAEALGAKQVIAADCNWRAFPNFLFARQAKNSSVLPLYNIPVEQLVTRLDSYLVGHNVLWQAHKSIEVDARIVLSDVRFDIVHNLGLMYHLRDPMVSLLQFRSVLKDEGEMLVETAFYDSTEPVMAFNPLVRDKWCVYDDPTTWVAPSIPCLATMLEMSLFRMRENTICISQLDPVRRIGRVAFVADVVPISQANGSLLHELKANYRTFGFESVSANAG